MASVQFFATEALTVSSTDELEAQLTKLRDQGLMLSGALAEVRRQLESLPSDEGTPAVEPVDFKSTQRRGS